MSSAAATSPRRRAPSGVGLVVMISTDKAVNPTSVMGATKRLAESFCQALDLHEARRRAVERRHPLRDGPLRQCAGLYRLGRAAVQRQLAAGGPLTVTHPEVTAFFMTVREAVELVLQASATPPARRPGQSRRAARSSCSTWASRSDRRSRAPDDPARRAAPRHATSRSTLSACGPAKNCTRSCSTPPIAGADRKPGAPPGRPAHRRLRGARRARSTNSKNTPAPAMRTRVSHLLHRLVPEYRRTIATGPSAAASSG